MNKYYIIDIQTLKVFNGYSIKGKPRFVRRESFTRCISWKSFESCEYFLSQVQRQNPQTGIVHQNSFTDNLTRLS